MWILMLLLIFAESNILVRGQCPKACICTSSYIANCSAGQLTQIPDGRFDLHLKKLDVSENQIISLESSSLRNMKVISLLEFNASSNIINSIDEKAFKGQPELQTADLSNNKLRAINYKTFVYNHYLEWLSLSGNRFNDLPDYEPFLESSSLKVLRLSHCFIHNFPLKSLKELPNLQELDLSHNKIENLDGLEGLKALKMLDLSHNHLNNLKAGMFESLPSVRTLHLNSNRLYTLNIEVMPYIVNIMQSSDLEDNPWICDCSTYNTTYAWCRDVNAEINLLCSSPPKLRSRSWFQYENLGCDDTDNEVEVVGVEDTGPRKFQRLQHLEMISHTSVNNLYKNEEEEAFTLNYFYTAILFAVLCLLLLVIAGILWYRLTSFNRIRRGPSKNDAEVGKLRVLDQ